MVDTAALISSGNQNDHTRLIPSQIKQSKQSHKALTHFNGEFHQRLVPSQVVAALPTKFANDENYDSDAQKRGSRNRKQNYSERKLQATGNLPDVQWRSIPMEHLRYHPNFEPLPLPSSITRLESLEDVRRFRQESWQWEELHAGRCTTSQAVAALGFLEPNAGVFLKVPVGWRKGGQRAYHRLSKPALRTLEEMNDTLCNDDIADDDDYALKQTAKASANCDGTNNGATNPYWKVQPKFPFAAKYTIQMTEEELTQRRHHAKAYTQSPGIEWSIRMMWGNTQESTSLLTALNYFWKKDSRIVLKEVGMCGAGLALNQTVSGLLSSGLLVGATPDAILKHPDGTIEAVEVKNHCPFQPNFKSRKLSKGGKNDRFRLSRQQFSHGVMPQYVPQLMMEMLCVGPMCKSAIMVRQSATNGALILRIHRDDEWINEMVYWLNRFQCDFVNKGEPPPTNFFYQTGTSTEQERYKRFLKRTSELESQVELVSHVPHKQIQRATVSAGIPASLFLD